MPTGLFDCRDNGSSGVGWRRLLPSGAGMQDHVKNLKLVEFVLTAVILNLFSGFVVIFEIEIPG